MKYRRINRSPRRVAILALVLLMAGLSGSALAHPLGNFTINHFARVEARPDAIAIRYVIDMAEIPAFQELQAIDADRDGTPSNAELAAYAERAAAQYAEGLSVTVDGAPIRLNVVSKIFPCLPAWADFRPCGLSATFAAKHRRAGQTRRAGRDSRTTISVTAPGGVKSSSPAVRESQFMTARPSATP